MKICRAISTAVLCILVAALVPVTGASAELVLSQLVVDLEPGKNACQDIEVSNSGSDILYVAVEPREILGAGTSDSSTRQDVDPEKLGLLVSPARMILDPGERKLLRVAAITDTLDRERVYRITVKPVVGQLAAERGGLKILVGYDVLVLLRPAAANLHVTATRSGKELALHNAGNVSVELTGGKQCDEARKQCEPLPGGRLYPGATKTMDVNPGHRASFVLKVAGKLVPREF